MAAFKRLTSNQKKKLQEALRDGLDEYGIKAEIDLEASAAAGRYRLFVISEDFAQFNEAERQDVLWRVIKERWARQDQLRITLSLALTEAEAQGTWS